MFVKKRISQIACGKTGAGGYATDLEIHDEFLWGLGQDVIEVVPYTTEKDG